MNQNNNLMLLTEKQNLDLIELAKQQKNSIVNDDAPIANDLLLLLEKKNITLLQYPIEDNGAKSFSAMFLTTDDAGIECSFIGLNTNDYYDKQIFSIVHELYHYAKKDEWHISRDNEADSSDLTERFADKFAAEFILPLQTFKKIIVTEFDRSEISQIHLTTLLRFIARIHCTWWLPYKSIVRRLLEAGSINQNVYDLLYEIDARDPFSDYYKIGIAIDETIFSMLNCVTRKVGAQAADLEVIVRNYEDGIISDMEFINDLAIFSKKPESFGVSFEISPENIAEINELWNEDIKDESES